MVPLCSTAVQGGGASEKVELEFVRIKRRKTEGVGSFSEVLDVDDELIMDGHLAVPATHIDRDNSDQLRGAERRTRLQGGRTSGGHRVEYNPAT